MDSNALYLSFSAIDDEILERSESAIVTGRIPLRRRWSVVLIAAILALFLMGASAVTIIFYGDSVQSWLTYCWKYITGEPMSDQHTALIDHLSQEIGLRETVDGVTVTVDSAMVGEKNIYILLRVEGVEISPKHHYSFEETLLFLKEAAEQGANGAGWSCEHIGMDRDGAALMLFRYSYTTRGPAPETKPPLQMTLTLSNFAQDLHTNRYQRLAEGEWKFELLLTRGQIEARKLPDTQVMGIEYTETFEKKELPILLTNMVLTNTDLSFQYDRRGGDVDLEIRLQQICVVLKNGQEISARSGGGTGLDKGEWYCTYTWWIPVALEEVAAVKIGDVVIPAESFCAFE